MLNTLSGVSSRSQLGQTEAPGQRRDTPEVALGEGVREELSWSSRDPKLSFRGSFGILGIKGNDGEILRDDCRIEKSQRRTGGIRREICGIISAAVSKVTHKQVREVVRAGAEATGLRIHWTTGVRVEQWARVQTSQRGKLLKEIWSTRAGLTVTKRLVQQLTERTSHHPQHCTQNSQHKLRSRKASSQNEMVHATRYMIVNSPEDGFISQNNLVKYEYFINNS